MRIRLGHVVFALIIASIINLAIAWLCAYYAVPGYQGAFLLTADEFDRGSGLVTERDHDLAIAPWTAFGITELDCFGPWYIWEPAEILEDRPTPQECADQIDLIMEEIVPDHDPLKQNGLRFQLIDMMYRSSKHHGRIDAGWPMRSFRGFVSGGVNQPFIRPQVPPPPQKPKTYNLITKERPIGKGTLTRYIPYWPIWFGLIVNTLLYASVMIAILWMLLVVRAKRRLHRKLCPNCKYPIGVSEICTECGHDLKSCVAKI